ncbi:MAG: TRAP transporter small permease [Rhodospirillaceae bacterium]|nr:TRAP transporter small permease [Rhodospirillaceae bacterium]MBT5457090.1 TRAP transporter small permease [Rhodospirillaceae bacterium]
MRFLAIIGGATLLCLMLLTVYAVIMRYVFNAPVLWALDYGRVGLVIVTFAGLAHCGWTGGHIAVDFVGSFAPPAALRVSDTFIRLICAVLIGLMAWQGFEQGLDALEMGEGTNEVEIPLFPFFLVVAVGCASYSIVLVAQALRAARGVPMDDPTGL